MVDWNMEYNFLLNFEETNSVIFTFHLLFFKIGVVSLLEELKYLLLKD